jgi:hypothetical protein
MLDFPNDGGSEQLFPEGSAASDQVRLGYSAAYSHSVPSQGNIVNTETRDHQVDFPFHPLADCLNRSCTSPRSVLNHDFEQLESGSDKSIQLLAQDSQDPQLTHRSYCNQSV